MQDRSSADSSSSLTEPANQTKAQQTRRAFLGKVGVAGVVTIAAGISGVQPVLGKSSQDNSDDDVDGGSSRRAECKRIRVEAAQRGFQGTPPNLQHPPNHDEALYPNKLGSYSKGLPHRDDGTVVPSAYAALLRALESGRQNDFNAIPLGGTRRLTNPQCGLAFDMEGADAQALVQQPAPAFASREQAAEISENYWMALLRDVPYSQYSSNPVAAAAAADLTLYGGDFKGSKSGGAITTATLFRGVNSGDNLGPYLSQFFYHQCNFGANNLDQKIRTTVPGVNYMTDFNTWLAVQRGVG